MKLVSVIVPLYNAAPYIEQTLRSILATTYPCLEVIVMDDGSTDDSLRIAQEIANYDARLSVYSQSNSGVGATRNHAIALSHGEYILPVDADDWIEPFVIENMVHTLEQRPEVKVVGCQADFFGKRQGPWHLPPFSRRQLAMHNMIPVTAMYRREDYLRVGGYIEQDVYREDWHFWLSVFEEGGEYVQLPMVGLHYRIVDGSRRMQAKSKKKAIVDSVNRLHRRFIYEQLGGPLHYHRSWSVWLNHLRSYHQVGNYDQWGEGTIIQQTRNTLLQNGEVVEKQFAIPYWVRGLIYGCFRKSKARRSYEYAQVLGELTPEPIAYYEERYLGILRRSGYVCRQSPCFYTFRVLNQQPDFPQRELILQRIGRWTAMLHKRGIIHLDYSSGNILFNEDASIIQIIDLNRMRLSQTISRDQGLANFERLQVEPDALRIIAQAYADAMGYDPEYCTNYILTHRWKKLS